MLADVHSHLDQDPAAALGRAQSNDVGIILAAAIDLTTSRMNVSLAEKYSQVKACIGVHPWRADLFTPETESAMAELIKKGKVTAISETGIDVMRRRSDDFRTELAPLPLEVQLEAFRAQVGLAVNRNLFLIVHDRGASKEILKVFDQFMDHPPRGIIHGFLGSVDEARQYRQRGFLISINKRNLPAVNPVLETLTLNEIVLETDSNEPAHVADTCDMVASLKGVTKAEVAEATTENLKKLLESCV
ncbi:Tat-linked quality control protein TatD [Peptococcaceae bacterium CEB3]|nr:Tat-linked quality control protein TatD [Peptococcaceae bacterium CEB3]